MALSYHATVKALQVPDGILKECESIFQSMNAYFCNFNVTMLTGRLFHSGIEVRERQSCGLNEPSVIFSANSCYHVSIWLLLEYSPGL